MLLKALLPLALVALTVGQILNPSKLLFRYSFDSLPAEDSGAQLRGSPTVYGNPTSTAGKLGNGVRLNQNGAKTDLFSVGIYPLTAPISVTAWFSVDSWVLTPANEPGTHFMKILSNKWQYDDFSGLEIQFQANGIWSVITPCNGIGNGCNTGAILTYTLPQNYVADAFHHVAVTLDASNLLTLYLDGAQAAQGTIPKALVGNKAVFANATEPIQQNNHSLAIGGSLYGTQLNQGGEWHGVLDEVRVYNSSLTAAQVQSIYNQPNLAVPVSSSATTPAFNVSCPATSTAAAPALVLYNDLLPKDSNGNQFPQFPVNWITLHRSKDPIDPYHKYSNQYPVHLFIRNVTTATIKNTGSGSITIKTISLADTANFTLSNPPSLPVTLTAGQTAQFTLSFIGQLEVNIKTAFRTHIDITTDGAPLYVNVAGLYMNEPEGSNEVTLSTILSGFGFGTYPALGATNYIDPVNWDWSNTLRDEVTSQYWRAADTTQQITVQHLVAFGGQDLNAQKEPVHKFYIQYDNDQSTDCRQALGQRYANTIVPLCGFTGTDNREDGTYSACYSTCSPNGRRFWFVMDGDHTSVQGFNRGSAADYKWIVNQISFKFFPARLSDGTLVANTYIVGQDYSLPDGCGVAEGQANCDYQDNIFIVTNIQPADDNSASTATRSLPVSFSFTNAVDGNPADVNGNGVQFPDRFASVYDTAHIFDSYDATGLLLNTSTNTLTISTRPGSLAENRLTNALKVNINPAGNSFSIQATLDISTIGSAYAGIVLGSDLFNLATLYIHNGAAYFTVQTQSGTQSPPDVFPIFTTTTSPAKSQTLPSNLKLVTLILSVDPSSRTITPSIGADAAGQITIAGSAYTLPDRDPIFGIGPAGRLTGYGVGVGIAAWNDALAASSNVNFYNFVAYGCGSSATAPTNSGTTSSNGATSSTSTTPTNSNDVAKSGTTTSQGLNQGSASSVSASIAVILAIIALML